MIVLYLRNEGFYFFAINMQINMYMYMYMYIYTICICIYMYVKLKYMFMINNKNYYIEYILLFHIFVIYYMCITFNKN